MSHKITDLEKFVLENVYRPYAPVLIPGYMEQPRREIPKTWRLHNAVEMLEANPEWRELVMDRITRCNFRFPAYIDHPLVDYIRRWSASCQCSETYAPCAWCVKDTEEYDKAVMNGDGQ